MARQARTEAERENRMRAIRKAALDIFSAKGFSAARLDDVAAAAGVAKGTIYLYFASKEDLLEAIVTTTIGATLAEVEQAVVASPAPAGQLLRLVVQAIAAGIQDPERRRVLHLVLSEGARFPAIGDFYHREIIAHGLRLVRAIAAKGHASGEFVSDEIERFPQLVFAPALLAIIWSVIFERIEPLDAHALLEAHLDLLTRALTRRPA
ncbi:TetR/AcrR family transcriptional regulator [Rhodoblastus acidophilus]|uniref:TetR/AcrR family transcriptional regulator n=1 Tax=Candidatus Rhodoblastus alkanivorans TaxID=2954117 RepID=A0ABS9Z8L8_9HYPH|nr:TetR/AcrR family transcriptional regulator [Candidatus Rhodoblastus alkanivorans]MCI4680869.1 TetR/AcrR family transcriptional regulator [Candidatus Rhodoblastus alkanivorans]MCI4683993.1 TetR/AcrR family transcriptional regulator [Candidatus Rhodoblastus alkanivorans]MDI4641312.1 TetR/AcrR family transcriptional regulator [Rhodoblastus acidophilus]